MPGSEDVRQSSERGQPELPPEPGDALRVVAGFRLLRRIGEGGMSTVYLSYDIPAQRPVAVKLLADHLTSKPEFISRFYREARLSRLLQHPNLVSGYSAGFDAEANKHYLVLEFVDGPSAQSAMAQLGRVPVGIAVRVGIDIAHALQFLHDRGYVHRDVKPDNILLDPEGSAKLADLGLAKRLDDDTHLTSVNQGVGTSYYMPYEQAMNSSLVDARSDIFSLGATLYHLLTGQVPFPGTSHEEIIRVKEKGGYEPARRLNAEVPEALDRIIARTLALDPRARHQRAAELAQELEKSGLATPIPSFAFAGGPEDHPSAGTARGDSPTRADFRSPVTPGATPLSAGPTPPPAPQPDPASGDSTIFPDQTSTGSRLFLLAAGGILIARGLLGQVA